LVGGLQEAYLCCAAIFTAAISAVKQTHNTFNHCNVSVCSVPANGQQRQHSSGAFTLQHP
jgi:hypothetical protein